MRIRHIVYHIFPHYLINGNILEKKIHWTQNACFDIVYNFCLKYFSFQKELSDIWSTMYSGLYITYSLFLSDFNETWIFLTGFRKILKNQISWKSVQWKPSCSMRTDGQTDRHDEANSRFSQFCKRAQKEFPAQETNVTDMKRVICARGWTDLWLPQMYLIKYYAPDLLQKLTCGKDCTLANSKCHLLVQKLARCYSTCYVNRKLNVKNACSSITEQC
jgi:hypothetical protein